MSSCGYLLMEILIGRSYGDLGFDWVGLTALSAAQCRRDLHSNCILLQLCFDGWGIMEFNNKKLLECTFSVANSKPSSAQRP